MKKKNVSAAPKNQPDLTRREFLSYASLAAGSMAFPFAPWMHQAYANSTGTNSVIFVFLRGAIDPMSLMIPTAGSAHREGYELARKTAGMRVPANQVRALTGTTGMGLHPSAIDLQVLANANKLKLLMGCGSLNPTTSHFNQQDNIEMGFGAAAVNGVSSGMFNRALAGLPQKSANLPAVSLTSALDKSLRGPQAAVALGGLSMDSLSVGNFRSQTTMGERLDSTWNSAVTETPAEAGQKVFSNAAKRAANALAGVRSTSVSLSELNGSLEPNGGHHYAGSSAMRNAVQLLKADPALRFVTLSFGSWDTHVNQGVVGGTMDTKVKQLSRALRTLVYDLERNGLFARTTIVVLSEFGRTVRENGNAGTDHGRGGLGMVLGAGLSAGSRILSSGFTLDPKDASIAQNVLPVGYDYRNVVAEVLNRKMGVTNITGANTSVFPGLTYQGYKIIG